MKKTMKYALLFLILLMASPVAAQITDFESFTAGSVNYQGAGGTTVTVGGYTVPDPYGSLWTVADEWGFTPATALDEGVVDDGTGNYVWRISNAVTQSGFSNLPFSLSSSLAAGESTAALWNDRGDNHTTPLTPPLARAMAGTSDFHANFRFKSATGTPQAGLSVSLSPGPRQGSIRSAYVSITDNGTTGLDIGFYDTDAIGGFIGTTLATNLSYSDWHELDIYITFADGLNGDGSGNDVVSIQLNGNPVHVGTTWETYYALNPGSFPQSPYAVDALMFRVSGTAQPGLSGGGLYFDDVLVDNAPYPAVHNVTQDTYFATIGAALAAANAGDEIAVSDGTYNENITIPVGVYLHSVNGAAATTIAGSGGTAVAINASNVELYGFTITNPTGSYAVTATDRSNLHLHDNVITNIGNAGLAAYVHSMAIVCSAVAVDNIMIEDNEFSYIEAGNNSSASAIAVGWSNGTEMVTNLVIQNNNIFHVRSNTNPWPVGHGAYGIILNHGTGVTGKTVGAKILNNTINDLEGLWAHGIGLEGNTPGALVDGNSISNLVDHKAPSDAVAVFVEANASLGTVTIVNNTFANVSYGVANVVVGPDFVNAINNDWSDASGPYHPFQNPNGLGTGVAGAVLYTPWTGRVATVVADLGVDPSSKTLGVDGYGYWEGTAALGLDDDFVSGFEPGAFQANVTAADPLKYTKYGLVPSVIFGRDVFVGELHSITYHTKKSTTHVVDAADWFCQMYTNGSAHGWYGERINAEPYFSENLTETPGQWTEWATAAGANNRLRFFDSNINFGTYTDGFLQDLTNNLSYADQSIMLFGLGTGSAWAEGFDGKVDGLTVELVSGETVTINFISGNAQGTITPSVTGPVNCSQTVTLTFSYTADQYTPDVFLYDAVVNATPGLTFGAPQDLLPFGTVNNNFFVTNSAPNQKTITGSTVGNPISLISGAGDKDLFTIAFTAVGDVAGSVDFASLTLRDPTNQTVPVVLTGATITFDCTAPLPVTAINAAPGNNKVDVSWAHAAPGDVDHYEVYRGLWYAPVVGTSAYPEYDDIGAIAPTRPTGYGVFPGPAGEWLSVDDGSPITTVAYTDGALVVPFAAGRGVYYYEVFAVDAAGNGSPPAAANDRATNYWLGDVSAPLGTVGVTDISTLGAAFGTNESQTSPPYNNLVDVGPTDDWSRLGIPTTDSKINFEDLMIFSLNFGVVTAAKEASPVSKTVDLAWVSYDNGDMGLRLVNGMGVKGLHVQADFPVTGVQAGELLDSQSELTFLKNIGENLDVSVAVMGLNQGFEGTGDLFVVSAENVFAIEDLRITVRSTENKEMAFTMDTTSGVLTPRVFALNANYPNPFNPMTKISFSLPESQDVTLAVYSLDGRRVATLLNETRGPGLHEVVWTGRNDTGQTVASGLYFFRIDAGPYSQVRKMTLMK